MRNLHYRCITRMTESHYKPVTHVIFDMDGLLLDTEVIYEAIYNQLLADYNKSLTTETRLKILGTTERRSAEIIIEDNQLEVSVDDYLIKYRQLCKEKIPDSPLMKGVRELVCHLSRCCIPFAIGTSSPEEFAKMKLSKHQDLYKLFHHMVCASTDPEVKQGKPAPDVFLVAAARFDDKPDPSKCLVFEDAPNGVQAALHAGMQVVMVPDARVPEEVRKRATLVLNSLEDFKPELFNLPPFPHKNTSC